MSSCVLPLLPQVVMVLSSAEPQEIMGALNLHLSMTDLGEPAAELALLSFAKRHPFWRRALSLWRHACR
jgi:hypothetical protein